MKIEEWIRYLKARFSNSTVEDLILKAGATFCYAEGKWSLDPEAGGGEASINSLSRWIAELAGTSLSFTQPAVDSMIPLGPELSLRAHAITFPLTARGTEITLRKVLSQKSFSLAHFSKEPTLLGQLSEAVKAKRNILISGKTGSGKTTLLKAFLNLIEPLERVVILEDSLEIDCPNRLSTKLLARNNQYGFREGAEWDLSHLLFQSLRMRPDRIILGECRGPEAAAIHQAIQTGHQGMMTTIHAGSALEAQKRFESLLAPSLSGARPELLWDLYIHLEQDGLSSRRHISEIRWKTA